MWGQGAVEDDKNRGMQRSKRKGRVGDGEGKLTGAAANKEGGKLGGCGGSKRVTVIGTGNYR